MRIIIIYNPAIAPHPDNNEPVMLINANTLKRRHPTMTRWLIFFLILAMDLVKQQKRRMLHQEFQIVLRQLWTWLSKGAVAFCRALIEVLSDLRNFGKLLFGLQADKDKYDIGKAWMCFAFALMTGILCGGALAQSHYVAFAPVLGAVIGFVGGCAVEYETKVEYVNHGFDAWFDSEAKPFWRDSKKIAALLTTFAFTGIAFVEFVSVSSLTAAIPTFALLSPGIAGQTFFHYQIICEVADQDFRTELKYKLLELVFPEEEHARCNKWLMRGLLLLFAAMLVGSTIGFAMTCGPWFAFYVAFRVVLNVITVVECLHALMYGNNPEQAEKITAGFLFALVLHCTAEAAVPGAGAGCGIVKEFLLGASYWVIDFVADLALRMGIKSKSIKTMKAQSLAEQSRKSHDEHPKQPPLPEPSCLPSHVEVLSQLPTIPPVTLMTAAGYIKVREKQKPIQDARVQAQGPEQGWPKQPVKDLQVVSKHSHWQPANHSCRVDTPPAFIHTPSSSLACAAGA